MEMTREGTVSIYSLMPRSMAPPITTGPAAPDAEFPNGMPDGGYTPAPLEIPGPDTPLQPESQMPSAARSQPEQPPLDPAMSTQIYGAYQGPVLAQQGTAAYLDTRTGSVDGSIIPLRPATVAAIATILAEEAIAYASSRADALRQRYAAPTEEAPVQPLQTTSPLLEPLVLPLFS